MMKQAKCLTFGCVNRKGEGAFHGDFCRPCYSFITESRGRNSQVFINAVGSTERRLTENLTSAKISLEQALDCVTECLLLTGRIRDGK